MRKGDNVIRFCGNQQMPKMTTMDMSIMLTLAVLTASSCICVSVLDFGWLRALYLSLIMMLTYEIIMIVNGMTNWAMWMNHQYTRYGNRGHGIMQTSFC